MIHYGDSHYLADSIAQAKHAQNGAPVILLGDASNCYYKGVEFHPISKYNTEAKRLFSCFKYLRLNAYQHDWQLFCFQRWLCLLEFMSENRLERCLTLDSDVLLYKSAAVITNLHGDVEMTLVLLR